VKWLVAFLGEIMIYNTDEAQLVKERYARRSVLPESALYSPLNPAVYMGQQEKERCLIRWIRQAGLAPVQNKKVLEIGCGAGGNLLQLIRLGFLPENLVGNELLPERYQTARNMLPEATKVLLGDASTLDLPDQTFDVVYQSTVFTSILDDDFQKKLAGRMWALVKPGGGVLWYDFTFNNPRNPDVRGVSINRVKTLFPEAEIDIWCLTLAPPISRRVTRIHPILYNVFNMFPFLRTHILCWIKRTDWK
jgi:SAM-dependent methyltransferase